MVPSPQETESRAIGKLDSVKWPRWGTKDFASGEMRFPQKTLDFGQSLKLQPDDVVILTFPKTGTTWLQNICEQLKSGGRGFDHFSEITEAQPWLELMCLTEQKLEDASGPVRCYKSHQLPSAINPGAKYVTICRNPDDVLLSWYAFQSQKHPEMQTEFGDPNIYIEKAGDERFGGTSVFGTNVFDYYVELWEIRNEPNVLLLSYEALKQDAPKYFPLIAKFMGVTFSSEEEEKELYSKVANLVSMETMRENKNKFDDNFLSRRIKAPERKVMDVPKVSPGEKPKLNEKTIAWMRKQWAEKVAPVTGHASYEDFEKDVVAHLFRG